MVLSLWSEVAARSAEIRTYQACRVYCGHAEKRRDVRNAQPLRSTSQEAGLPGRSRGATGLGSRLIPE